MKLLSITTILLFHFLTSFSQSWLRCSNGLPADTAVYSLAKIGNTLYAGTQQAGVYKSTDGGNTWITTNLHHPFRLATVRTLVTIDTFLFAGQSGNGITRTTLNSDSWTYVNNGIANGNGTQVILDMIAIGDTLYAASFGGGVFTSPDKGEHWTLLYNNQGLNDPKVISLAANHQFLFAGTAGTNFTMPDTGVAFVTSLSNGDSWSVINNGLERNGAHLEAISALATNDTVAYAGTDDVGIHRSTDNGQTWFRIPDTNLNGDIWAIKIIDHQVFYGTLYHGIFTSDDSGLTYYENNAGLNYNGISIPDLVHDFVVLDDYIYAATTTGVYKQLLPQTSDVNQVSSGAAISAIAFPNPFNDKTNIQILCPSSIGTIDVTITDVLGKNYKKCTHSISEDITTIELDLHDISEGIYFYFLSEGNNLLFRGILIAE